MEHFEPIFETLDRAGARYVIVGGVAVNLHGHQRFTKDLDLALELAGAKLLDALLALEEEGYRPTVPVRLAEFADPEVRERWIREKNMQVFQMYHDSRRVTVDIMVTIPVPFEDLWKRALDVRLERTTVKVASIEDLIRMKRDAGRPQDLMDIEALETIRRLLEEEDGGRG